MPGRLLDLGEIIGVVTGKDAPMLDCAAPAVAERFERLKERHEQLKR